MMSEIPEGTLLRDGVAIEKGITLTREFLDRN
jgi:hypothetical protein